MDIHEWNKRRLEYGKRANKRNVERLNMGASADEDIPYYAKTIEEVLMDPLERVEKIEELYKPAPETEGKKTSNKPSLRFT